MTGKILKISSNDLYGNVDDRMVSVFACFEHTKYMNNYVIFSIDGSNKLCYGSIHLKKDSLVIFSVKSTIKKYIDEFLDEYINDKMSEYKILDINNINKVELVSYNDMDYDKIQVLNDKSIEKVIIKEEDIVSQKPVILYVLLFVLIILGSGLTLLYFMPELFSIKYKVLECTNNIYDEMIELNYKIEKNVEFNKDDKVDKIDVVRTYAFLDSDSYDEFKNNNLQNKYFTNGEGYKYIDSELKFKLFYNESSVIDDYDEMFIYLKKEGYSCIEREYEK